MVPDPDPLVEELVRARRDRGVLVVAMAIGIIAGVTLGMASFLGAIGSATEGARGGHALLVYFVAPLLGSLAIGYAIFALRARRRDRRR